MTDKEKYDFIDHVVHLTLFEEDRLLNEHGGDYSGLEKDGIDSNEYYRIVTERVINTLNYIQEESVSEELEVAAMKWFNSVKYKSDLSGTPTNAFKAGAKWGKNQAMAEIQAQSMALAHGCPKEPVSENLGEYINELSKQIPEVSFAKLSRIAVRVAKWQKAKLIANATKVTVHIDAGGYPYIPEIELYDYNKDVPLAKEGDKYKVVLFKED